jgi:DNA primase
MVIYPETNSFYCFRCNKSGTPETIVMKQERIPYHKAREKLYGVEVLASSLLAGEVTEVKPNQQYMMDKLAELIFAKKHLITNLPELIKHLIYCNISVREYIKILKQLEQL